MLPKSGLLVKSIVSGPSGAKVLELVLGANTVNIDGIDNLLFAVGLSGDGQLDLAALSEALALGGSGQSNTTTEFLLGRVHLIRQAVG